MMVIRNIIRYLQQEDELLVTRLGKFQKKEIPSTIQEGQILPPKVIVEFEMNEEQTGFPIVDHISKWEFIRLLDADEAVNNWVSELKNALQENKEIEYENFGTFRLDESKVIRFESAVIKELNEHFYGMEPLKLEEQAVVEREGVVVSEEPESVLPPDILISKEEEKEEIEAEIPEETATEPIVEEVEEPIDEPIEEPVEEVVEVVVEAPVEEAEEIVEKVEEEIEEEFEEDKIVDNEEELIEDEAFEQPPKKRRKRRVFWNLLFIFIILGTLALLLFLFKDEIQRYIIEPRQAAKEVQMPTTEPTEDQDFYTDYQDVEEDSTELDELTETETDSGTETAVQPETSVAKAPGSYPVIRKESGKFYAIAGSLLSEQDAIKHIKEKNLDRYNPSIVHADSRYRVCIGIFNTEEEAFQFAKKINSSYWVLK